MQNLYSCILQTPSQHGGSAEPDAGLCPEQGVLPRWKKLTDTNHKAGTTTLPAQALPRKSLAQSRPGRDLEEGSPAKAGMAAVHQREREGGEDMQLSHAHGSEQGGGERTVLGQEVLEGPWSQLSLF